MQGSLVTWLDGVGSLTFTIAAWAFLLINAAAVGLVAWKRNREFVNRWTPRFLAANLVVLGVGLGVPMTTFVARTAIRALSPALERLAPADQADPPAPGAEQPR